MEEYIEDYNKLFEDYNTARLNLIDDPLYTTEEKRKIFDKIYDEYLSKLRKLRIHKEALKDAKLNRKD